MIVKNGVNNLVHVFEEFMALWFDGLLWQKFKENLSFLSPLSFALMVNIDAGADPGEGGYSHLPWK